MSLTAAEKTKFAQQEQEIIRLRTELNTATTQNERITQEAQAERARNNESIGILIQDREKAEQEVLHSKQVLADKTQELTLEVEVGRQLRVALDQAELNGAQLQSQLQEAVADLVLVNAELTKASSTKGQPDVELLTNTDGRQFQLKVASFNFGGQDYQAADVLSNSSLLERLVSKRAGILEEVLPTE